jgi:hypothetical protein
MNVRFGDTGTRHEPRTVELQLMSEVIPGKVEGDQENETCNRDDNRCPVRLREEQDVVPWVIALFGPRPGEERRAGPSRRVLRAGGLRGAALAGADPASAPGLVQAQDGRGYKDGAVGAGADANEKSEGEVAQGGLAEDE